MQNDHPFEWRFSGDLGYGGKFWRLEDDSHPIHEMVKHSPYYVTCYCEDETSDRLSMIKIANNLLKEVDSVSAEWLQFIAQNKINLSLFEEKDKEPNLDKFLDTYMIKIPNKNETTK